MDDRVWHYIRPNESQRIPRRHVFMDTKAVTERTGYGHRQTWRCGVARFWAQEKGRKPVDKVEEFDEPMAFWNAISAHAGKRSRTVVWAHNLGYGLRISQALSLLPIMGWTLDAHNLARNGAWLVYRRSEATLVLVDSASVFPTTLAAVGKAFGMAKRNLASDMDADGAWLARCHDDVEILSAAVMSYLQWIEEEGFGNWQMTGAGQSWSAFRHRFMAHKILVHCDDDALRAERRASWTGRTEAYWHGQVPASRTDEWDLQAAYARIAKDTALPVKLVGRMPPAYPWLRFLEHSKVAILARVIVRTPLPVVPTTVDKRIVWPVGEFETTLWDVEIKAAMDAGAEVTVLDGWLYRRASALAAWGEWIVGALTGSEGELPAWKKIILKHWSRALIGRFAMQYPRWTDFGRLPGSDIRTMRGYDMRTGEDLQFTQLGNQLWQQEGNQEWQNSVPAITGYIMAVCRVRLWKLIQALPPNTVYYVDTDSLLVSAKAYQQVAALANTPLGEGLRLKRSWRSARIHGPRQIVTEGQLRAAGMPRGAQRVSEGTYEGEVWESLKRATETGRPGEVRIMSRTWRMRATDFRRSGGPLGWTQPVEVERNENGQAQRRDSERLCAQDGRQATSEPASGHGEDVPDAGPKQAADRRRRRRRKPEERMRVAAAGIAGDGHGDPGPAYGLF